MSPQLGLVIATSESDGSFCYSHRRQWLLGQGASCIVRLRGRETEGKSRFPQLIVCFDAKSSRQALLISWWYILFESGVADEVALVLLFFFPPLKRKKRKEKRTGR